MVSPLLNLQTAKSSSVFPGWNSNSSALPSYVLPAAEHFQVDQDFVQFLIPSILAVALIMENFAQGDRIISVFSEVLRHGNSLRVVPLSL